ncbi:hypothetical protein H2198_002039 [Neophaeococcomyces mojaviensis]|uniref:Uncharacterized protein n=1 Tax=Neophaeococcomyces mojaviensis TaxID=3383035 RepID=A0ACC3AF94_9EURO|nr:hypothetical protein H2198_002039 [Knufia sp. JES_112]
MDSSPSDSEPAPSVFISYSERPNGAVATVSISNPTRLNSLNLRVYDAFVDAISSLAKNPKLRCVVVTGSPCTKGEAFVGGADIVEMSQLPNAEAGREFITGTHRVCQAMRDLSVPVIARINGHALGAGLLVAGAADLKIASSKATFGMPEVKRGVPSTVESALLPGQIGEGRARRLLILGDVISATTAESWGLVDRVVEPTELDQAVEEWVEQLLEAGPRALAGQKRLMKVWEQVSIHQAIEAGIWEFGRAFEGEGMKSEGRRMMSAFLERNKEKKVKSKL